MHKNWSFYYQRTITSVCNEDLVVCLLTTTAFCFLKETQKYLHLQSFFTMPYWTTVHYKTFSFVIYIPRCGV